MSEAGIERAGEIIDEIMSGSEFNRSGSRVDVSWLRPILEWISDIYQKVMEWLQRLLERLFSRINFAGLGAAANGARIAATIVIAVLVLLLVIGLTVIIIRLVKNKKPKRDAITEEDLLEFSETPDLALELAEKYRVAGDYRMSYRYLFINLLTEFNRREVVRIAKYKTNRMYRREAVSSGKVQNGEISPFFSSFDTVWYGFRNLPEDELNTFFTAREAVLFKIDSVSGDVPENGDGEEKEVSA